MFTRFSGLFLFYLTFAKFGNVICGVQFRYHENKELEGVLESLSNNTKAPLTTEIYSIGTTAAGNKLWVFKLTAANESLIGTPSVKLIGNTHGDEPAGREILLHFIEHLITNYGVDHSITWLLNNTNIHILPSLNPDGFEKQIREVPLQQNIDLNRNFPAYFHNNSHVINKNVIESNAIMHWMENHTFILSAALHSGALVANYPFDIGPYPTSDEERKPSPTADEDVFRFLASTYANNHPTMHKGEPCPNDTFKFKGGITNGAAWYDFDGGMGDYNYAFHGCMELTLEMSCSKYPGKEYLPILWEQNKKALLQYCMQAHRGVTGQILDFDSGLPITNANLTIVGRKMTFWSTRNTGEFWRVLLHGKYKIKVEADGYHTKIVSFSVPEYRNTYPKLTFLEIKLQNSTVYTATEETTTQVEITTINPKTTIKSMEISDRFGSAEEPVPDSVKENVQMLQIGGSETIFVKQISLQTFLVLCILLYLH